MSFFRAGPFYQPEPTFTPLFRLLDDFDNYSRQSQGPEANGRAGHHRAHIKTFSPKFDLKETETNYELHGELPGIEKENVHIEFTDPQTILVRGRVERSYTAGTPPVGQLEGTQMSGAITESGEQPATTEKPSPSHKATVEDDPSETTLTTATAQDTPATANTETAESNKPQEPKVKYWISERSIGEFSRSFNFPTRIEADGVRAGLNNGVLTVTVPKAKKHESRRIAIN